MLALLIRRRSPRVGLMPMPDKRRAQPLLLFEQAAFWLPVGGR